MKLNLRANLFKMGLSALALSLSACGLFPEKPDNTLSWSADTLYQTAKEEREAGNYEKAAELLEKLEARYPFGNYAQQAQLDIAYTYYKAGDKPQALETVDRFLKTYPDHANADYAYYLRGLINFNDRVGFLGNVAKQDISERDPKAARDSFAAFKDLVDRYPQSRYAADSLSRMKFLVNMLAQHEVHVARYYLRKGAYLAAVNRAQYALTEYRDAPAVEEALSIMVRSYDALELSALRDDAKRVLQLNYPHSVYLR